MPNPDRWLYKRLVQIYSPGGRLARIRELKGGISARMTALEVIGADGVRQKWVARRIGMESPNSIHEEYHLLLALRAGGVAVAAPLFLYEPDELDLEPVLGLEYVEGAPEFNPANVDAFTRQAAWHLAHIHRTHIVAWRHVELGAESIFVERRGDALEGDLTRLARSMLRAAWPPAPGGPDVLLHGDYWPGNWLWRDGQLVAVIDWEDAGMGDPLRDLATSRLEMAWAFGADAMRAYTAYYRAEMPVDERRLALWDVYAALRMARMVGADLAGWARFWKPYGRGDLTVEVLRGRFEAFLAEAMGKEGTPSQPPPK